jgi:hypothetical protein
MAEARKPSTRTRAPRSGSKPGFPPRASSLEGGNSKEIAREISAPQSGDINLVVPSATLTLTTEAPSKRISRQYARFLVQQFLNDHPAMVAAPTSVKEAYNRFRKWVEPFARASNIKIPSLSSFQRQRLKRASQSSPLT